MIRLRSITKFCSSGYVKTFVLRNIGLDVRAGEFLTIMDPSGAGKSTLLHMIGMLDEASTSAIPVKNPEAGKRKKNHPEAT